MTPFVATVALVGIVIVVASLMSGLIERVGVPLVAAFLLLGLALGPEGFGLVDIQLRSPELQVLATLGLALVLFSDAVGVNIREAREHRRITWVVLGPGTIIVAIVLAGSAYWLLGVSLAGAAVIGGSLASTDPVLLRTLLRSPRLPATARVALRLESGMNDVVLLPVVVLAMITVAPAGGAHDKSLASHLVGLFLLGPLLGALVGWVGITMLSNLRSRVGVRRDYESLYALGLGFTAYAAAEAVGGSGFLAAFAAGLAIASLDLELCDCFLEYGEATAEMLLLLTFVAFGTSLIWTGFDVITVGSIVFAIIACVARTLVLYPVLKQIGVHGRDRKLIALFGPRGLSSLLLVLLPVFAGVPGSADWFRVTCLVVLVSLVFHGAIIGYYLRRGPRTDAALPAASVAPRAGLPQTELPSDEGIRISIDETLAAEKRGDEIVYVDSRAPRSYDADPRQIRGSVRVPPDDPVRSATESRLSQRATLVVYCA